MAILTTKMRTVLAAAGFLCVVGGADNAAFAQETPNTQTYYAYKTFKENLIVNGQSTETTPQGEMKVIIAHRFGAINSGAYNLFGLDAASIRLGVDYGITNDLMVGIGRSSLEKTFDGFLKYKLLHQCSGAKNVPVSVTVFGSAAYKTERTTDDDALTSAVGSEAWRLAYTGQVLIARKFSDRVSLQIMPTYLHRNLVATNTEHNDIYSVGIAPRVQISRQVGICAEYYYVPSGQLAAGLHNSLAVGVEIETKGHVFQIHAGNSRGMIEKFFVGQTSGSWENGDIYIGFNMTRNFRFTGRKLD